MSCIFCKIVSGEIPAKKVYENEKVVAFNDISPVAPVHVIIIPKEHVESVLDLNSDNMDLVKYIIEAANIIARDLGIDKNGFRLVNNCKEDGGQTVNHIHFHLLGGRNLQWPPG